MAAKTEPNSGLFYGWALGEQGWNAQMDANLKRIGRVGFHLSAKDKDLSTPPGMVFDGDTYIIGAAPTDAWEGHAGSVAVWSQSENAWAIYAPRGGWLAYVEDEDAFYYYAGDWALLAGGGGGALPDGGIPEGQKTVIPDASTGEIVLDFTEAGAYRVNLARDVDLVTLQNPAPGKASSFTVILVQDATGGRKVTWPESVVWIGGEEVQPAPDPETATSVQLVTLDGLVWYGIATSVDLVRVANYVRRTPINAQTGTTYTLAVDDAGCVVRINNAAAITVTLPDEATEDFAVGDSVALRQVGDGQITITPASGVTLNIPDGYLAATGRKHATIMLHKVGADEWDLTGDLAPDA